MKFLDTIGVFCRKHDSAIFAVVEIGLATASVIFAAKNTEDYICTEHDSEEEPKEKAKRLVKAYWPTMVCYGSLVALRSVDAVYTHKTKQEYAKALMAAQSALMAYRERDKKRITTSETSAQNDEQTPTGEELVEARVNNAYDQYEYQFVFDEQEMPEPETSVYFTPSYGKRELFYIPLTGRLFVSNLTDVQNAEAYCRAQIESGNDMFLNEMYKYLGIGSDNMGSQMYIEGDAVPDDMFIFDLMPACIEWGGDVNSDRELMWTIQPNRWIKDINVPQ